MESSQPDPTHHASAPGASALPEGVRAQRGALVRLAYRMLWDLDDAEDAVQNAMLLASRRHDQLADRGKIGSWLRSIVVRQCQDARRAIARHVRNVAVAREAGRSDQTPAPVCRAERSELRGAIRGFVDRLPERQRTALVLRHLEQMEYGEIAAVMEISETTVRVHVRNAREVLRTAMLEKRPEWARDFITE